ncbi:hypothetical protein MBLNU459_g7153t1 [Dothideomycetes sp. NU459]
MVWLPNWLMVELGGGGQLQAHSSRPGWSRPGEQLQLQLQRRTFAAAAAAGDGNCRTTSSGDLSCAGCLIRTPALARCTSLPSRVFVLRIPPHNSRIPSRVSRLPSHVPRLTPPISRPASPILPVSQLDPAPARIAASNPYLPSAAPPSPPCCPAMDVDTIPNLLAEQRDAAPDDLQHYFLDFEDFWERKLWHELTNVLVDFFHQDQSAPQRLPLYNTFIKSFAEKINQLKLVTLGLSTASQCKDDQERRTFLATLAQGVDKHASQDAFVYAKTAVAAVELRLSKYDDARKDLDSCERILDTFDSVENIVHAAFYRTNADYYQAKHEFASYYRTTLLYLACIDLDSLPVPERQRLAYDLSVAALVSESIYNFGELLLHPILDSLKDTEHSWLRDLIIAFNRGDLGAYDVLAAHMEKNDLLKEHHLFLYQKISLSALTETVFRRPPHDRAMTFSAIAQETKVQPNEIEHLIMKALSLGLLRGTIDQVDEVARIQWVQPKVLDKAQIEGMRERLRGWDDGVNKLGHWMEGVGKEVWAV